MTAGLSGTDEFATEPIGVDSDYVEPAWRQLIEELQPSHAGDLGSFDAAEPHEAWSMMLPGSPRSRDELMGRAPQTPLRCPLGQAVACQHRVWRTSTPQRPVEHAALER